MQNCAILATLLAGSLCTACAVTSSHTDLAAFLKAHEHTISATESRLEPGDTFSITAPRVLEIDGESQRIQPDGKISLDLIGDVKVAGLTTREVASKLQELLGPYYIDPTVHVRMNGQPGKVYYVLGQVGRQGPFRYTGRDTLMHVLALAQPNNIAWKRRVKIIRPSPIEGERREIEVNVDAMIKTGDMRNNILLEPGDVVYVPPTPLGWIGLRIRELLDPVAPVLQAYGTPNQFLAEQAYYEDPTLRRSRRR